MSLKPIDPRMLKDPEESTEEFATGATAMHHYENVKVAAHEEASKRKHVLWLVVAVLAVALVAIGTTVVIRHFQTQSVAGVEAGTPVTVTITSGSGDGDIAQLLQSAGIIDSTKSFMEAVSKANADGKLKGGTYTIAAGSDPSDVVAALMKGPDTVKLTIAEGLTVQQTADKVQDTLGIPASDFLAQAKASNYVTDYPFLAGAYDDSLEGFLFPETYSFSGGETADDVIRAMLDQFKSVISTIDLTTATQGGVTLNEYQVVVLASLIERETAVSSERPLVASVIYNRLNAGMYLQIDAAIAYALNKTGLLTEADLQVDSPYNVYTNHGLTPGPICSPSAESIRAAAAPAATGYYYYVASSALDGTHVFCETDEEFEAAREAYNAAMGIG